MSVSSGRSCKWSPIPIPAREFIQRYELPQIVRIHDGENKRFQATANLNLQEPILLYKVYTCRKIHGRALAFDAHGHVRPTGPTLIIPDSYQGWLAMVADDGRTAGFFSSIGEVSRAEVPMFLVQEAIVGLKTTSTGLIRSVVPKGQVLKAVGPFEDLNRQSLVISGSGQVHPDIMMYLKCITQQGEHIFFPYSTRGRFYCIATPKSYSLNHIFLISNLLRIAQLPLLVRIVYGEKPTVPLPFTNIIQLEDIRKEVIILGCTLVDNEPVLLEINANSNFSFIKSTDNRIFRNSALLQSMCDLCTLKGDSWRKQIRIAHHVVPKTPRGSVRSEAGSTSSKKLNLPPNIVSKCQKIAENCISESSAILKTVMSASEDEEVKSKKSHRRSYTFPKKFWMFRRSKKMEFCNKNGRKDGFNTISGSKSKNHKYTTVKITTDKGAELLIGGEKVKLEVQRFIHSDDGYVTSHNDDESIYHSIC